VSAAAMYVGVYNLGGWTVDSFFSCSGHFYIIYAGHKTSEQVLFDVFLAPVWIIYLVFSSPGGIILYIVCTSSAALKICCKSRGEIIRLHRLPYHTSVVLAGLRCWSPNGTDDDVNIHISRLTSIFPSHRGRRWHTGARYCIRPYKHNCCVAVSCCY